MTGPQVRPGQVWADNDKRSYGRKIRIVEVDERYAVVEAVSYSGSSMTPGRRHRILLDRLRPTSSGYRLVSEPEAGEPS